MADQSTPATSPDDELLSPLGSLSGLDHDDFREAAYEVFFTACRSTTTSTGGLHGRGSGSDGGGPDGFASAKTPGVGMAVISRVKKALGLKMVRRPRRSSSSGATLSSPRCSSPRLGVTLPSRLRRPMTSAEIMRQQMRVTEQSDSRLRKTLMRTLVGQMGRRAETIILPLELLRHLKPGEFNNAEEYHQWQKRQLKILQIGLLRHPLIPLDKSTDTHAAKLEQLIEASEAKPIDMAKNSEAMRALCNSIISLAWRSPDGGTTDVCHWADGYPLNVEIYMTLLRSVFDLKDDTLVLDEVDELLELIRKTWSMLGINRSIHNLCFAWVLFKQYVVTGQVEFDLLGASLIMLSDVGYDARKAERGTIYTKMLVRLLSAMKRWGEKRLLDYHEHFDRATVGLMESILPLVSKVTKILEDYVPPGEVTDQVMGNIVDYYIRSSSAKAFVKVYTNLYVQITKDNDVRVTKPEDLRDLLIRVAREIEEFASKEKDIYSPVLKKWHPNPHGASAVTLHACYGTMLKQHLSKMSPYMNETILALQRAGKLEKALIQMAMDGAENTDKGKAIVRRMVSYEADMTILKLLRNWMQEKLQRGKESLERAKDTEIWMPKSKTEPFAQSGAELIGFAKETVESFLEVPVNVSENLVSDLTDGLELLFGDYISFVASCGSKQGYLPTLPPLTRCSCDSTLQKLWKKTASAIKLEHQNGNTKYYEGKEARLSVSRGTQRLYIRLNTLHYLLVQLQSLDKTLSLSPKITPPKSRFGNRRQLGCSYFEHSRSLIQAVSQRVAEVAAYRLIFLDTNAVFYRSLYAGDVATMRIKPALGILRQNLAMVCAIIIDKTRSMALKEVMKACFEAYLMVLLAGGSSRVFSRKDHPIIEEDFDSLKQFFFMCGEGLIGNDEVAMEAETVEGVVTLMGKSTEQLVEEFSVLACESSGIGILGTRRKLPMPPTTGKWHSLDPNTILRVLCHRNDRTANHFLKRTFKLAKRSVSG
ncbi:protein unc-13 homolog [Andrographis paniculata]|uniref:protein unc-13 homolog n=1 Tax=Andrographis paniculata TaxID=175694 RepID=UPI0021E904DD|nr:protein unc-13 homolog [Andrographis paniculata]